MTKSQKIIPHIMSTLWDTISMILKERCIELMQCGGRYTGDHMFTKSEVRTSTIKIKFCDVHLTGMQKGLVRYTLYL